MTNPWLKKNPLLSLWLSGANAAAGRARGQIAAAAARQQKAVARDAARAWTDAWTGAWLAKPPRKRRR